jgi:exodeoxyribonuclease-3
MRIATWNVNGLRARMDFIKIWLKDRQPDIVGMQELKVEEDEFPADEFKELGYHTAIHSQKSWNGVGILSRHPIELQTAGLPGQADMGARLISASIQDLSFTTVYVPNGKSIDHEDFPRKLSWYESLAEYWAEHQRINPAAVLCGDFNVVPTALDTWQGEKADGSVFHTKEERRRLEAISQTGMFDLFREKYPHEQQFSWWDYRGGAFHRKQGLRIDFVYGTPTIFERTQDIFIDRDFRKKKDGLTASDHAPVVLDLK